MVPRNRRGYTTTVQQQCYVLSGRGKAIAWHCFLRDMLWFACIFRFCGQSCSVKYNFILASSAKRRADLISTTSFCPRRQRFAEKCPVLPQLLLRDRGIAPGGTAVRLPPRTINGQYVGRCSPVARARRTGEIPPERVCFIDLQKAHDPVDGELLWEVLTPFDV